MPYDKLLIHLILNWLPLWCSVVFLQITPCCLVLNLEIQKNILNEATRANLQANKRILKWQQFWNKMSLPKIFVFTLSN